MTAKLGADPSGPCGRACSSASWCAATTPTTASALRRPADSAADDRLAEDRGGDPFKVEAGRWEVEAQLSHPHFESAFRDPDSDFGPASDTESEGLRGRTVVTWRAKERPGGRRLRGRAAGGDLTPPASAPTWTAPASAPGRRSARRAGGGPVRLDVGLRRDDNDVYGAETSLRAGSVVNLGGGFRARASYGESFRAPSLGEL